MEIRDLVFDNLIGDLDYHPRRGILYLCLGVAALSFWFLAGSATRFDAVPLVIGSGGLSLALKAIFLLRKTSRGIDTSRSGLSLATPDPQPSVEHPSEPRKSKQQSMDIAQLIQDFGTGPLLLWTALEFLDHANPSWNLPVLSVAIAGGAIFAAGWGTQRILRSRPTQE